MVQVKRRNQRTYFKSGPHVPPLKLLYIKCNVDAGFDVDPGWYTWYMAGDTPPLSGYMAGDTPPLSGSARHGRGYTEKSDFT